MRPSHVFSTASVLALFSAAVYAQPAARETNFNEWDTNRNGVLEKAEFRGHPGNFDAMDANHDRVLSRQEFVNRYRGDATGETNALPHETPLGPTDSFHQRDRNRDGVLSSHEWTAADGPFDRIDRDDDGQVTLHEYQNHPAGDSREAAFDDLDRNNDHVVVRGEWTNQAVLFETLDYNRDGRLTFEEYAATPNDYTNNYGVARFEDFDRDRDGVISHREWTDDRATFDRLDRNNDRVVTAAEFRTPPAADNRQARFDQLDRNNDRAVSRREWTGDNETFKILDQNNDSQLTRNEYMSTGQIVTRFQNLDNNRDGWLSRQEWRVSPATFNRLDRNRDRRLSRDEFGNF